MTREREDGVELFVSSVRELHPGLEQACLHGNCYKFHKVLSMAYTDAVPYVNAERDHVVTRIGDGLYDITGRIGGVNGKAGRAYHVMSASEEKAASKWRRR